MYNVQAKCNANLYRGMSRRELRGVFVNIDYIYNIQQLSNSINMKRRIIYLYAKK